MQKNSAKVWDQVWNDPGIVSNYQLILAAERATIRWQRLEKVLRTHFSDFTKLKVLEIGAGSGTYAALFAELGASVTLLDYSPKALARAKEFFRANSLPAKFVKADALRISPKFKSVFDISISVGLTEHFKDDARRGINQSHLEVLKKNGLAVMIVPNAYNPPYRIFKAISELTGTWKFGEEYPYTRRELFTIAQTLGAKVVAVFGDDLYSSIRFLLPANFLRRFFKVGLPRTVAEIQPQSGSPLDNYLAYSLILVVKKTK